MRFAFCIQQDVPRLDIAMQYPVFMRVLHRAGHLRYYLRPLPDRDRRAPDYFIKLAAFDELHAEVTLTFALAHLVNGNNAWMFEAGSSFRLSAEALQMRFGGPRAQADHFERDGAIETFLMSAINNTLTAAANLFHQFIIAQFSHDCDEALVPGRVVLWC